MNPKSSSILLPDRPFAHMWLLAVVLFALLLEFSPCLAVAETQKPVLSNTKLGLFVHYVFGLTQAAPGKPPLKNANQFCDALDVNGIADMATSMGAQYVVLTSYHWRMTTLFPSKVWGSIFTDHVCKRDLIGDLAAALNAKNIRLVLYVHPDDRHDFPLPMLQKLVQLGLTSKDSVQACLHGKEPRDPKWNELYYRLLNEIGRRYGRDIAGYWEDDGGGGSNGVKVQKIMLHYTPDAAIWVNGFVSHPPATLVGGENWNLFDRKPAPHLYNTTSNQVAVVIARTWWAEKGELNYSPANLYRFLICSIATKGQHNGGVVYATSPFSNNQWENGIPAGLAALGRLIKARAKAIYNTVPSRAYVSGPAASQKPVWGVAVDSIDGKTVYLHVLIPPAAPTLNIGKPADGVIFEGASLLNGKPVALSARDNGYDVTLPTKTKWNTVDTVIALKVK